VISKQKKCSIDIDEDEEAAGWNRQSVPEISDDDESFNQETSPKDYEELIKDFPDPFNYVIGFTCSSSESDVKRSTIVVSTAGDKKINESLNRDLESSPVPLYSKTYHQAYSRGVSSSMDTRSHDLEVRFQQIVNGQTQ
jgi:hypothetical protein